MKNYTTEVEVRRIAAMTDPAARNLRITQSYHELSLSLSRHLGSMANWCTFATWASRQAGQTIRREDLSQAIRQALHVEEEVGEAISSLAEASLRRGVTLPRSAIVKMVVEALDPLAAAGRASEAVGRGNQKVYAEIGLAFARFLEMLENGPVSSEVFDKFCETLRPGEPPDGQGHLRSAFTYYMRAISESNAKPRAELILLANLEIGFHEQTRLQPEIAAAVEAGVEEPQVLKRRLLAALFPRRSWLADIGPWLQALLGRPTTLDRATEKVVLAARRQLRHFLTARLMELGFPENLRLRLGRDLQVPFPAELVVLENPELCELLKKIDPTADSPAASGAIDWADLPDRLHFITDLFRCYQFSDKLLGSPFTVEEVDRIKAG